MDTTALLVKFLPASVLPYLKFVVTVLGGAASSVVAAYPGIDHRYVIAAAVATALATYLTPNVQPVKQVATVAESVDPESDLPPVYNNGLTGKPDTPVAATPEPVQAPAAAATPVHEIGV